MAQRGRNFQSPQLDRWPDLKDLGLAPGEYWTHEIALGQLYFAHTKHDQAKARRKIKDVARRGPNRGRQALRKAVLKTPQAKREFSGHELLTLVDYKARRQFMWAFLQSESGLTREQMKDQKYLGTAKDLANEYSFLGLKPEEIFEGMRNPRQADKDTAEKFRIHPSSVRSLLSKSSRR